MWRKSNASLNTTFSSTKDSSISIDQEQNEISALIPSYSLKEDQSKFFNKSYALYEIKLFTRYKTWSVHKRYSQFIELRDKLLLKKVKNIPPLPPKLYFINEQKLSERQLGLEEFMNDLFRNVNILRYPEIIEFIQCPKDIIDILMYNIDYLNIINLNSSSIISTSDNNIYYRGRVTVSRYNSDNNKEDINNDNFYCSLANMKLNDNEDKTKNIFERNISFEEDKSPGSIVIQEFLRNMMDTPYNKTELLFQFEYFLLNKKNDENFSTSNFNWYYLTENEIKIFFKGFYSNISHTKINGFLYHCGSININKIAAEQCLEFLSKLLSEEYNPQAEIFNRVYKKCNINDIMQLELGRHINDNTNSVRNNAFIVLYKYLENEVNINDKAKKILGDETSEKLFDNWYKTEF